jgi:hypothetical protein
MHFLVPEKNYLLLLFPKFLFGWGCEKGLSGKLGEKEYGLRLLCAPGVQWGA